MRHGGSSTPNPKSKIIIMSTEVLKVEQPGQVETLNFFNKAQFETMQRIAMVFVNSELVPDMYRISDKNSKDKATANVIIALEIASRIGASPLMVMQNLYIVYGRPGWSSKFLIATVNTCGKYEPLQYKMTNLGKTKFNNVELDNWECIAYTNLKGSDEVLDSSPVSIEMAIAEGWYGKNGSKWKTMPKKMLRYRAASFWTNEYAPELSMGMKTADEIEDIDFEVIEPAAKVKADVKANANKETIGFDDKKSEPQPEKPAAPAAEKKEETKPEAETKEEGPRY
jgi:hypothetical protein